MELNILNNTILCLRPAAMLTKVENQHSHHEN